MKFSYYDILKSVESLLTSATPSNGF